MPRLLLPLVLSALLSPAVFAATGPAEVVTGFYTARLADGGTGVPSGRQLATYSSYLGPELVCTLGASIRYQDHFDQAHPDSPSGLFRTDLYSSGTSTPTSFTLGTPSQAGGITSIPIHFTQKGNDESIPPVEWDDTVKLRLVRNRWLISDIDYSGTPEGGNQGSLMATLRDRLHGAPEVEGWSVRELDSCVMDSVPVKKASRHTKNRHTTKSSVHGKKTTSKASASAKKSTKSATSKKKSATKSSTKKKTTSAKSSKSAKK